MGNRYVPGAWNAICDVCGFEFKSTELKDRWDGQKVCEQDWEPRNILDFYKPILDHQAVAWSRDDVSLSSYFVANVTGNVSLSAATIAANGYKIIIDLTGGAGVVTITLPVTTSSQFAEVRRVQLVRLDTNSLVTCQLGTTAPDSITILNTVANQVAIGDIYELLIQPARWVKQI